MPSELFARIDLDKIYPPFLERILQVVADCANEGKDYYAISGYRSHAEQAKLWAQGRTQPGKRVTNAGPWESPHNFGLAIDFCPDADVARKSLQPDWNPKSYALLGAKSKAAGLVWGGGFRLVDLPHVQWPGYVTARELFPFRGKSLAEVWAVLDRALDGV